MSTLLSGDNSFLFGVRTSELNKHPKQELGHPKMHVKTKKVLA